MSKSRRSLHKILLAASTLALASSVGAHETAPLEKNYYNYSEWTKGLFAEAVVVRNFGNGRMIYLGGIGAEEEEGKPGDIRAKDDAAGQCVYTFEKIDRVLKKNQAGPEHIVKMTSYLTSPKYIGDYIKCRNDYFSKSDATLPAETLLIVQGLAWPEMLLEVDVDALAP
ncbi:RidA family protein [Pusillimonas sp.]|uniref:RidA family protein n=1 Tax=Pusillimonas sp. TaxID=3040095 RepID=UPI0029ADAA47|nr:RidA family protein [Pusillimonas sp.]MDX3895593.1 RidA family protein [Pusillimonas sp.]